MAVKKASTMSINDETLLIQGQMENTLGDISNDVQQETVLPMTLLTIQVSVSTADLANGKNSSDVSQNQLVVGHA